MKLVSIVGARPQFIKAASVSLEFLERGHEEILVHTGQHYDDKMSGVFFDELGIPNAQYLLECGALSHGAMTGKMLAEVEEILIKEKPCIVVVYGDTNSTLAGALAASKLGIPLCHVEAGLRSYNKAMPEEQNRVLVDHLSSLLLCSSSIGVENLKKESITQGVYNVGDVMADTLKKVKDICVSKEAENSHEKNYYLMTLHRAENVDCSNRLKRIVDEVNSLTHQIVFPLHPRTKNRLKEEGLKFLDHVSIVPPVGYIDMVSLLSNSCGVLTDSGGLQKEAYWLKKPCVTLRDETEWVETLNDFCNQLYNPTKGALSQCMVKMSEATNWQQLYGTGSARRDIVGKIEDYFKKSSSRATKI